MVTVASDFSFTERAVIEVWIWLWFFHRVWATDKFASLQWHKLRNFDLKSIITLLIFIILPLQAMFDIIWTYLKYKEGFYQIEEQTYITKPAFSDDGKPLWTEQDITLKTITEYLLALGFALQIGILALMQAFWSHLSCQMGGKPFMRSWKFKFYVSWVIVSMITFPTARIITRGDNVLIENVPLFIYSMQLVLVFGLGIKNGLRLNDLLKSIRQTSSPAGQETMLRIHYFIDMNKLLMFGALLISLGFSFTSIDAMVFRTNGSKFLMDFFMINANLGSLMLWATMILIIYPRYYITGSSGLPESNYVCSDPGTKVHPSTLPKNKIKSKNPIEPQNSSFVINLTTTTTTTTTTLPMRSHDARVGRSVTDILEQQQQQIDSFKHKASMSISSTGTVTTLSNPTSPLFPSVIYEDEV